VKEAIVPEIECVAGTLIALPRFFFRAPLRAVAAMLGALLLCSLSSYPVAAQNQPTTPGEHQRLSGTIISDQGHSAAIFELPHGDSVIVHEGDSFGGGRILKITDKTILIRYAQGDRLFRLLASGQLVDAQGRGLPTADLSNGNGRMGGAKRFEAGRAVTNAGTSLPARSLQGSGRTGTSAGGPVTTDSSAATGGISPGMATSTPAPGATSTTINTGKPSNPNGSATVIAEEASGQSLIRSLARTPTVTKLDELVTTGRANKTANLNQLLRPLVNLPQQANIVAIDHQPLGSTLQGIINIRDSLAQGNAVSLNIDGLPDKQMMYLMPSSDSGGGTK
jgi:hypothetical protein